MRSEAEKKLSRTWNASLATRFNFCSHQTLSDAKRYRTLYATIQHIRKLYIALCDSASTDLHEVWGWKKVVKNLKCVIFWSGILWNGEQALSFGRTNSFENSSLVAVIVRFSYLECVLLISIQPKYIQKFWYFSLPRFVKRKSSPIVLKKVGRKAKVSKVHIFWEGQSFAKSSPYFCRM